VQADTSEKIIEVGMAAQIYTQPGGSHFILESLASFWQIKNETKCLPHPICQAFKHAVVN